MTRIGYLFIIAGRWYPDNTSTGFPPDFTPCWYPDNTPFLPFLNYRISLTSYSCLFYVIIIIIITIVMMMMLIFIIVIFFIRMDEFLTNSAYMGEGHKGMEGLCSLKTRHIWSPSELALCRASGHFYSWVVKKPIRTTGMLDLLH